MAVSGWRLSHANAGPRSQILRKLFANLRRSLIAFPKQSKRICEENSLLFYCLPTDIAPIWRRFCAGIEQPPNNMRRDPKQGTHLLRRYSPLYSCNWFYFQSGNRRKLENRIKKMLKNLGGRKNWYNLELLNANEVLRIVVTVILRQHLIAHAYSIEHLAPVTEK